MEPPAMGRDRHFCGQKINRTFADSIAWEALLIREEDFHWSGSVLSWLQIRLVTQMD